MKRRLVSFGCSHAFGAEMHGSDVQNHDDNFNLNYANFVAQHYNLDFKMAARPGNSNKQILHDVIEQVKPNDVCLLGWTYADRDRYIKETNNDSYANVNFSTFHALKVLYDNRLSLSNDNMFTHIFDWFSKESVRVGVDNYHYFLKDSDDKNKLNHLKIFCQSYYEYYASPSIKTINFLEMYHSANAIIQQRGALAVNFHFSMDSETIIPLKFSENLSAEFIQSDKSYSNFKNDISGFSKINKDKLLVHPSDKKDSKLFDYYNNDNSRLTWQVSDDNPMPLSFKDWYMRNYHVDLYKTPFNAHDWPDGRLGHLGPHAHELLSNIIINHLKDII
jgi:hypothetical protein